MGAKAQAEVRDGKKIKGTLPSRRWLALSRTWKDGREAMRTRPLLAEEMTRQRLGGWKLNPQGTKGRPSGLHGGPLSSPTFHTREKNWAWVQNRWGVRCVPLGQWLPLSGPWGDMRV